MFTPLPRTIALAVALVIAWAGPAAAQDPDVYTRTAKGTALIVAPPGGGAGWVVDRDRGLLLTNDHVVARHGEVEVIFPEYDADGRPLAEPAHYGKARRFRAEVIDADGPRDLALIRLRERPPSGVTALKVADRDPRPAERVHSIGNPDASGAMWVYSTGTVRQVYRKAWRYGTARPTTPASSRRSRRSTPATAAGRWSTTRVRSSGSSPGGSPTPP